MLKTFFKSLLWSAPVALLLSIMQSYDMALKLQNYPSYRYESIYDLDLMCQLILFCVGIIFISIPVFLSLKSDTKYKGWIITLDMLCFIPFGILFYFISLIWSICEIVKFIVKDRKTTNIKYEIVNNEKFLTLNKAERIKYLQSLRDQTAEELKKQNKEIENEQNKLKDLSAEVAKYVKHKKTTKQKQNIMELENKVKAIDEMIKSETEKPKGKKKISDWGNYLDD